MDIQNPSRRLQCVHGYCEAVCVAPLRTDRWECLTTESGREPKFRLVIATSPAEGHADVESRVLRRSRTSVGRTLPRAMCGRLQAVKGYRTGAASVGAAMCSAYSCGSHKAAGHNAFRGSGPGQQLAFDNAVAQVGCPDRRVDQSCITWLSALSNRSYSAIAGAISFPLQQAISRARLAPCNSRPWPSGPKPSWRACWRARSQRPSSAAGPSEMSAKDDAWRRAVSRTV